MRFKVTAEELAMGTLVDPGWYPVEITKVEDTKSKGSGAAGVIVSAKIIGGKDEFIGVPVTTRFYESGAGFTVNFFAAVGHTVVAGGENPDINNQNFKGQRMQWFIDRGEFNGKKNNQVNDYRAIDYGSSPE